MLRRMIVVVLVAALAWGGYWALGAWGLEKAVTLWLEDRRADGWQAEAERVVVRGFPNRFDLELDEVRLADPRTGWAWSAPFFQSLALSYKPYHVIAVWPDRQSLQTPYERLEIRSDRLRGSLMLTPTSLALKRSSFELDGIELVSDAGWTSRLTKGRLATRTLPEDFPDPALHQISFSAEAWQVPSKLLAELNSADLVPDTLDSVTADVTIRFSAPWDRRAIEQARPQPRHVEIKLAEAKWGRMELKLAGSFEVNEAGVPEGSVLVKATNWREILAVGIASGVVPADFETPITAALEIASQLAGSPKTLDIPLNFKNGQTRIGPAPISPAPVILLR
ncbi:DUF2125 domain-containing protein [Vannielia litorea]|uniref:DUF2125 domain-containing protein n=1 Tax=Vannielia litorea TaxID=1217970 RepID=UPI001C96128B|nr:DUF2125 domain-containing protein [Vannielia litorea]MBY6049855.1 DUF2125 domain-containing protein [Vannielia litorea]MBY6077269.1 DUF2125 domain-containing protein [Vannielia litorea]